jgi:PAS domain S-box-containing protein
VLPIVSVGAALILSKILDRYWHSSPFTSVFICAILFSAWLGGLGPGLLAILLSCFAFDYYFLPPTHSLMVHLNEWPRLIIFAATSLIVGLLASLQRNTTESLRRTRDELAAKVQELERINEALHVENAERKLAEGALQRIETYLSEGQRLSHTGSWAWEVKTKENLFWSKEHYRIYGFDPETSSGQYGAARQRIHPDDARAFDETFERAVQERSDFEMRHRIVLPSGEVRHIHTLGHPVLNDAGELVEYIGTAMDVTEQHQARAALDEAFSKIKKSEAYLAEAQKLSRMGSFALRLPSGELECSEETIRIMGYEPGMKFSLEHAIERVHPEDVSIVQALLDRARREGADLDYEHRLLMPDKSIRHVHVVARLMREGADAVEIVGAVMDITERKRAEEALRKSQAELAHVSRLTTMGELTASIAHEVNQPLAAVVNNANACISLLSDGAPNLEEVREALTEIIEDADRASAVIARVRQLARKAPFERSLLDLKDVITDVLALARYESATRRVTIRAELPEELPPVAGDHVQLQQVLLNLVVNGMDAMNTVEESKRLLVICVRRETRDGMPAALLSVQDAGTGFKPEEMGRLFEAFYTTKPQGMGMGLAISRSIIEVHGGRLWAEPNQGPGATFLFSLPVAGNAAS